MLNQNYIVRNIILSNAFVELKSINNENII